MPIRIPSPTDIGLVVPQADRPIVEYRGGIAQEAQEAVGQGIAKLGEGVSQVGGAVAQAQDQVESTSAYSNFLQKKLQLDQQFEGDTDYTTKAQRYGDAISQAANDSAANIRNVQLRSDFIDRTMRWQEYGINTMAHQARANAVDADRAYVSDQLDKTADAAGNATDPAMRVALYDNFHQMLLGMQAKGSITQVEGEKLWENVKNQASVRYFKTLSDTDPLLATRLLMPGAPALPTGGGMPTDLAAAIHNAAYKTGADEDVLARTAQIESGGQAVTNPTSGAAGPFQFMPATARSMGLANPNDAATPADAAARLQVMNKGALTDALGRAPSGPELYLAHGLGAGGATAVLQHPNENAIDALTPAFGSQAMATKAVLENGGNARMTAADFAQTYFDRFNGSPAHTPGPTPQPTTDAAGNTIFPKTGDLRDYLRPDQRSDLLHVSEQRAEALARAQEVDDARTQRLQEKALKDNSDATINRVLADVKGVGDNPNITASQIADPKGPYNQLLPEARKSMIEFVEQQSKQTDADQAKYGSGFFDLYQRVHASPDDPNRIADPQQIFAQTGPGKSLTVAGADKLISDLGSHKTPEGAAEGAMKTGALAYAKHQISFEQDLGAVKIRDPKGEDAFNVGFLPAFFKAYDAGIKDGKTPFQLLSKDSPDFIVDKLVGAYKRSPAQIAADMLQENEPGGAPAAAPAAAAPTLDPNSQSGIIALYNSGKMTRDQATQALISKGYARPAAPATAPAPTGPRVPTNE